MMIKAREREDWSMFDVKNKARDFGDSRSYQEAQRQKYSEDRRYRDVRGEQDLNRKEIGRVSGKGKFYALIVLLVIGVALLSWLFLSVASNFFSLFVYNIRELTPGDPGVHPAETAWFGQGILSFFFGGLPLGLGVWWNSFIIFSITLVFGLIGGQRIMARWRTDNILEDVENYNTYINDDHIALIEEMQTELDYFPDAGVHSSVSPTSIISHMAISRKGLPSVDVLERDDEGFAETDDDGELVLSRQPIIDEDFGQELFTSSKVMTPKEAKQEGKDVVKFIKRVRQPFDATQINYNKGAFDRDKLKYDYVSDLIEDDWEFPLYETTRPGGVYLVDTSPANTNVIAITRAGKGQTYIEPMLDAWTREKRQHNIIVNDPKGELTVQFYVPATVRGYEMVRFDLMNPVKTDIYNLLLIAADYAKEGDFINTAQYVDNAADVFFPKDNADDPMWPNAASNAFKRSVYGLIDFFLEEENYIREKARVQGWTDNELEQELDELWGYVSLYNAFQLFVVLSGQKSTDTDYIRLDDDDPATEKDLLTLFFDATAKLPRSGMRQMVIDADNSLRAMAGSDKTIASVYGIALTEMAFFTDPTISTLTSGRPSMNFDARSLSFPRRIRVRFHSKFLRKYDYMGKRSRWTMYRDASFTDQYDPESFSHEQVIDRNGWAVFAFDGKVDRVEGEVPRAYVKLEILNDNTNTLVHVYYFKLELSFRKTLNGRSYLLDPVLQEPVVKDGILTELQRTEKANGPDKFQPGNSTMTHIRASFSADDKEKDIQEELPVFSQKQVNYTERPKFISYITPPHLKSYAKLSLIMIKQTVDANFAESYTTKDSQKPLYKTRFMLDELGNLESGGSGIQGLQTYLSIGLGQEQQFTLVLQTLQQLRDVYGESVDKIISGNIGNTIFLKSNDNDMLKTLEEWSGKTHRVRITGRTITKDKSALPGRSESDSKESINQSFAEEPVISTSELLSLPERDSIVFRTGKSVIWNRGETILPMSWKLLGQNPIQIPGTSYSLETLPTNSLASKFDVKKYQPNFRDMLNRRIDEARNVEAVMDDYKKANGLTDDDISKLDQEEYSKDIMRELNHRLRPISENRYEKVPEVWEEQGYDSEAEYMMYTTVMDLNEQEEEMPAEDVVDQVYDDLVAEYKPALEKDNIPVPSREDLLKSIQPADLGKLNKKPHLDESKLEENTEMMEEARKHQEETRRSDKKVYAQGLISESDLLEGSGVPRSGVRNLLSRAYGECYKQFVRDGVTDYTVEDNGQLLSQSGQLWVKRSSSEEEIKDFVKGSDNPDSAVYDNSDEGVDADDLTKTDFDVQPAFIKYLAEQSDWSSIAGGQFDKEVARIWQSDRAA